MGLLQWQKFSALFREKNVFVLVAVVYVISMYAKIICPLFFFFNALVFYQDVLFYLEHVSCLLFIVCIHLKNKEETSSVHVCVGG